MSREIRLSYSDLITLSEDDDSIPSGVHVRGVAFRSGVIANKGVFVPDVELSNVVRSLEGAPFLVDHSHSIRDICGTVTKAWQDNSLVRFKGEIVDKEIAEKIRQGLVNSVSVGLHVQDFEDIKLDGQGLKKLNGITVKELSLVLFPAVEGATFEPSFEFSFEEADDRPDTEASSVDIASIERMLASQGKIAMERAEFDAIQNELAEKRAQYERISKQLWMLTNCDEIFNANTLGKEDTLTLDQIQFLWSAYQDMSRNIGPQGVVADESQVSSFGTAKEDIREIIFGTRRDGKLKGLRSIRDVKL